MPKGWPFRVGLGRASARRGSEELRMVMKGVTRGLAVKEAKREGMDRVEKMCWDPEIKGLNGQRGVRRTGGRLKSEKATQEFQRRSISWAGKVLGVAMSGRLE